MSTIIHWFRQDLRISDNPSLFEAAKQGRVIPVYILDDINPGEDAIGGASRWWLHHSLRSLNNRLDGKLQVFAGDPLDILPQLAQECSVQRIHWNRCYEPWQVQRDTRLKKRLQENGIKVCTFNGSLLWEPWDVMKKDGSPYKVFTPFYQNGCLCADPPRQPLHTPPALSIADEVDGSCSIDALGLLPHLRWDLKLENHWSIGESAAHESLHRFLEHGIPNYKEGRDFPAMRSVSRLSPHLHWGEISPNQLWFSSTCLGENKNVNHFHRELGWREFSHYLLYHFPELPHRNLDRKFDRFPWAVDAEVLRRWQLGLTGIPLVDAGMRELWETGYMHNRVRMVVASFLTKNLLLHWHHGEAWFWDCLVDADLANNSVSWQWVAGCGADAAPYFRIFNPVIQGQKFDPTGEYTRCHVPELRNLPDKYLFIPWEAPSTVLEKAGVVLGDTYPNPIVDLKLSRNRALKAYAQIKG